MSDKKRLNDKEAELDKFENDQDTMTQGTGDQSGKRLGNTLRTVNPLGMRVLVRILEAENQSPGGLYLPEGAKEAMQESLLVEVLEVASAVDDDTDDETNISGIPEGATVLIAKEVGIRVPWDDALRIVDTKDVLAIVEEISLS